MERPEAFGRHRKCQAIHESAQMTESRMQVTLFGTGAMACLFAARLARVAQVTMLGTWAAAIDRIRERGIVLEAADGNRTVRVAAEFLGTTVPPADLAIVLVKSWQTRSIAPYLDGCLKPDGVALSLQNGLGNLPLLGRAFAGVTAEGATLLGPGHVRHGGSGQTHIVASERIADLLRRAGFDCHRCAPESAEGMIWGKLAVNCGINALTALLGVRNGVLLERDSAMDLLQRAAAECAAVAAARGIRLPYADPELRIREVLAQTAENQSSMLQDILRGAPTECDAIHGAVVLEGRRLGVPTPVNDVLWHLLRAAAHNQRSCVP